MKLYCKAVIQIPLGSLLLTAWMVSAQAPVHRVTDPGAITTRQTIAPAGVQSVFAGRVQAVAFCGADKLAVAVSGGGGQNLSILSTAENRVLAQTTRTGRSLGIQGAACISQGQSLLLSGTFWDGKATLLSIGLLPVLGLSGGDDFGEDESPRMKSATLPADSRPPVISGVGSVAGLATSADGHTAVVAITGANEVAVLDTVKRRIVRRIPVSIAPFGAAVDGEGRIAWVSNWGGRLPKPGEPTATTGTGQREDKVLIDARGIASSGTVSRVDLAAGRVTDELPVGLHPTSLAWDAPRQRLYVVNGNSDSVSAVDTENRRVVATWDIQPFATDVHGVAPTAVVASPDGRRLYIACGGLNAVAVMDTAKGAVLGLIPTGWYPAHLALSSEGRTLAVATLLGVGSGNDLNRVLSQLQEELPGMQPGPERRYVHSYRGTVHVIAVPEADQLEAYTRAVAENTHLRLRTDAGPAKGPNPRARPLPVPLRSGEPSQIQHVVYIVKENRTYDQIFGDMERGNSDPSLVLYGEDATPNHHALARQFVLLDNFYATGGNSGDGHQWVTQSSETDYAMWPGYAGRSYPFDGDDPIAYAAGGFLWDAALKAGKSFADFGEFIPAGQSSVKGSREDDIVKRRTGMMQEWKNGEQFAYRFQVKSPIPPLSAHLVRDFPSYGGESPDVVRARIFLRHLHEWEESGQMPNLTLAQLPTDHTGGTMPGWCTPKACLADNDLALGQIVEGLTHSKFWPHMAIYVVEDDAQGGVDHVDGHRTVALAISPHIRRQTTDSTFYSHPSIARTIELQLGLNSLSIFDLVANDLRNSFSETADLTPYTAITPKQSIFEVNPPANTLQGQARKDAQASAKMNWAVPDAAPTKKLLDILWRNARGYDAPPAGQHNAVFLPYAPPGGDDDDTAEVADRDRRRQRAQPPKLERR